MSELEEINNTLFIVEAGLPEADEGMFVWVDFNDIYQSVSGLTLITLTVLVATIDAQWEGM